MCQQLQGLKIEDSVERWSMRSETWHCQATVAYPRQRDLMDRFTAKYVFRASNGLVGSAVEKIWYALHGDVSVT